MKRWQFVTGGAALFTMLAGPVSAASPGAWFDFPADAFWHASSGGTSTNIPQESVSLEIGPGVFSRKSSVHESPAAAPAIRMRQALTPELAQNFGLFLYISKAARGPLAQHMYVYRKQATGRFELLHDWPVSTGRERVERNALGVRRYTVTPPGYYELDPQRIYADYHSLSWDEPMPHAMFFDAWHKGVRVGLAIHATDSNGVDDLGSRASAGCVRLSPSHAKALFELVNAKYRGRVPRLAYDASTRSTRRDGALMRDSHGRLRFADGYRVLVIIENFGGDRIATQ